jgi:hypothetical protein
MKSIEAELKSAFESSQESVVCSHLHNWVHVHMYNTKTTVSDSASLVFQIAT